MDIHIAAKYMHLGYRIMRSSWVDHWIEGTNIFERFPELELSDLLATDWKVITEGIVQQFPIRYGE